LTDVHGLGARKLLAFGRKKDGAEVTVGRFTVKLKIVGDYMSKFENMDGSNLTGPKKSTSEVHLLPPEEPLFKWRVRVDLRAALDFPLNRTSSGGLPSAYCELGWSLYE
jgi:hypothetical protein